MADPRTMATARPVPAEDPATVRRYGDRIVGATEDLPEWLAAVVASTEMDPAYNYLNEGVDLGWWRQNQK